MSVSRVQEEVDAFEFVQWQVYEELSPGEPERGDIQSALVASVVANAFRSGRKAYRIQDFLLKFPTALQLWGKGRTQIVTNKLKNWMALFKSQQENGNGR